MTCGVNMPVVGDPHVLVDLAVATKEAGWDGETRGERALAPARRDCYADPWPAAPHRRPIERARRWDGMYPLSSAVGPVPPADLAELVKVLDPPPGHDVVASLGPGMTVAQHEQAGATWIIDGTRAR